jgi:hypothetical protein
MSESLITGDPRQIRARRHDATGRSTSARHSRRVNLGPTEGIPWTWHTVELLKSAAWRGMGLHTRKLLEFLEVENMSHSGQENGNLVAPYTQLVKWGVARQYIAPAIADAERRGLLRVERGGRKGTTAANEMNRFRLTFLPSRTAGGGWQGPTNEWRQYGER